MIFRPSYQNVISKVFTLPQDFTIIALTATATVEVQQDIREKLKYRSKLIRLKERVLSVET